MSLRPIIAVCASAALVFVVVPVLASADNLFSPNPASGSLVVYTQVISNPQTGLVLAPSDFTANVLGGNASPSVFPGSINGVRVLLTGDYSVSAVPAPGFIPTYSAGCAGTLAAGGQALCIITETVNGDLYGGVVTPYPYPYKTTIPLTCSPAYQTVGLGQQATFWATGGEGVYNWSTPNRTYLAGKASLTTLLRVTGTQTVIVSNNTQTATCTVDVVGDGSPVAYAADQANQNNLPFTTLTTSSLDALAINNTPISADVVSTYVPALPNTGFEPLSTQFEQRGGAPLAFAIVCISALVLTLAPYVRKITISSVR